MSVSFIEPDFAALRAEHKAAREREPVEMAVGGPTNLDVAMFSDGAVHESAIPRSISDASNSSCLRTSKRRRQSNGPFLRRVSFDTITSVSPPVSASPGGGNEVSETDRGSIAGSHHVSASMNNATTPSSFFFRTPLFVSTSSSSTVTSTGNPPAELLTPTNGLTSYFVSYRHQDLRWTHNTRTFLFAYTQKEYSVTALKWLVHNLIQDGDELVCIKHHVTDGNPEDKKPAIYQKEAELLLDRILEIIGPEMKINVVVELGVGKVKTVVNKSLLLYQPSIVVVGANQKSFSNLSRVRYKKSVPSYLIAKSQVPVIMVTPWMAGEVDHPTRRKSDDSNSKLIAADVSGPPRPPISRSLSDSYDFNSNNPYLSAVAAMAETQAATNDPTLLSLTRLDTEYEEGTDSKGGFIEKDNLMNFSEGSGNNETFETAPISLVSELSPNPTISPPFSPLASVNRLTVSKSAPERQNESSSLVRSPSSSKWMSKLNIGSLWSKSKKG
jgi:Universal stress protein family